jgi:fructose-1,6-bisphosphatase
MLATHHSKAASETADLDVPDIDCTTEILESRDQRIRIKHTDQGREIIRRIEELTALHDAYQKGLII